jgi:uncharacterized membrane protein YedE/YeeE
MIVLSALLTGLIFGLGLVISGMVNPAKVLGFLDVAGAWDPSLLLVMGGAVAVGAVAFLLAGRRERSVLGAEMMLPASGRIDRRLMLGSLVFGIGWGIAGFCPGPAVVAIGMAQVKAIVFVIAMLAGMGLFALLDRAQEGATPAALQELGGDA